MLKVEIEQTEEQLVNAKEPTCEFLGPHRSPLDPWLDGDLFGTMAVSPHRTAPIGDYYWLVRDATRGMEGRKCGWRRVRGSGLRLGPLSMMMLYFSTLCFSTLWLLCFFLCFYPR